jgi:hypothetical protein
VNHTEDDRLRSVRRFVSKALKSPPWSVLTERSEITDQMRPVALVEAATPSSQFGTAPRATVEQGMVGRQQTLAVTLFPVGTETVAGKVRQLPPSEARRLANEAAVQMERAVLFGLVPDEDDSGTWPWRTPPLRIPVFDFEGVPTVGANRAGPDAPYAWMSVEDAGFRSLQDPQDTRRWSVVGTLRLSWQLGGRVAPPAPLAGSMLGSFDLTPGP